MSRRTNAGRPTTRGKNGSRSASSVDLQESSSLLQSGAFFPPSRCRGDLESVCRCRLCRLEATMSAPPLGTSQVWNAERRRGAPRFHANLHGDKCGRPAEELTPANPLRSVLEDAKGIEKNPETTDDRVVSRKERGGSVFLPGGSESC